MISFICILTFGRIVSRVYLWENKKVHRLGKYINGGIR